MVPCLVTMHAAIAYEAEQGHADLAGARATELGTVENGVLLCLPLCVGPGCIVQGRFPGLQAEYNWLLHTLEVTSSERKGFVVIIQPTDPDQLVEVAKLEDGTRLDARLTSADVLRFDSVQRPEFWLEVHLARLEERRVLPMCAKAVFEPWLFAFNGRTTLPTAREYEDVVQLAGTTLQFTSACRFPYPLCGTVQGFVAVPGTFRKCARVRFTNGECRCIDLLFVVFRVIPRGFVPSRSLWSETVSLRTAPIPNERFGDCLRSAFC